MSTIATENFLKDIGYNPNDIAMIQKSVGLNKKARVLVRSLQQNIRVEKDADKRLVFETLLAMLLMHSVPLTTEILEYGVDPNIANNAPLRYTLHSGNIALARLLLGAGADDLPVLKRAAGVFPWYVDVLKEAKKPDGLHLSV